MADELDPGAAEPLEAAAPPSEPADAERPRWWSWLRPWRVAALVLGTLVLYYLVNLALVVHAGRTDEAAPVDAIVVLGAAQYDGRPSPQLAARLDHVVELWDDVLAGHVVVTGGKQPGDRFTEAEASAVYLEDRGIPATAILWEREGHTTYDSLAGAADVLEQAGLETVLLVTDPYHAERTELIARELGLDARSSPTPTSVVHGWTSVKRHLEEAAGVSLGRIIGFRRLTDLTG